MNEMRGDEMIGVFGKSLREVIEPLFEDIQAIMEKMAKKMDGMATKDDVKEILGGIDTLNRKFDAARGCSA